VKVRSAGFPDWVIVRVFAASASVAVAVIVAIAVPSAPLAVAGALIAGWVLGAAVMVRAVVALAVALAAPLPSLTVHTTLYVPAEPAAEYP